MSPPEDYLVNEIKRKYYEHLKTQVAATTPIKPVLFAPVGPYLVKPNATPDHMASLYCTNIVECDGKLCSRAKVSGLANSSQLVEDLKSSGVSSARIVIDSETGGLCIQVEPQDRKQFEATMDGLRSHLVNTSQAACHQTNKKRPHKSHNHLSC